MFFTSAVTVTSARTQILSADWTRQSVIIRNISASIDIKVGGPDVTFANGFSLLHGEGISLDLSQFIRDATSELYGIADTGQSAVIEVLVNKKHYNFPVS